MTTEELSFKILTNVVIDFKSNKNTDLYAYNIQN